MDFSIQCRLNITTSPEKLLVHSIMITQFTNSCSKFGIKSILAVLLVVFLSLIIPARANANDDLKLNSVLQYNQTDSSALTPDGETWGAITLADSLKETPEWNFRMGKVLVSQNNYLAATKYFQKAVELFATNRNKLDQTKALHQLALVYLELGDFIKAIGLLQQTFDKYQEMNDDEGMANLEIDLGRLLRKWNKNEAAKQHLDLALRYFEKTNNTEKIKRIEFEQALLQLNMKQYQAAEVAFKNLLDNNDALLNIQLRWISLLSLSQIYLTINQPDTAILYLNRAVEIAVEKNDNRLLSEVLLYTGQAFIKKGNWIIADSLVNKSFVLAMEMNMKETGMEALRLLSIINTKTGKLNEAIDNLYEYIRLDDEVFSEEGNLLINQLMISHETEQIKKAYNHELKKNLRVSKELLTKQETKNMTLIVGAFIALVSLIIVVFLMLRTRENRKGYALLAYKNKKISEQKEILSNLNLKLSQSREQYRSIVENAAIGMYQTTVDGKIKYANNALKKMLRFPNNTDLQSVNLNDELARRHLFIRDIEEKRVITGREDVWKRYDGTDIEVNESAWIVSNNKKETLYYEGVVEDISDRKAIERAFIKSQEDLKVINNELIEKNKLIEKSKNEAIRANEVKSMFLANVSHEIRTPMNSIIGFSEVLESRTSDKQLLHYIQAIKSSGISLLTLLNDILDLSKIQAKEIELHFEPVTIASIAHYLEEVFHVRIQQKELQLKINLPENPPKALLLDKNRLRQVLTNLVDNAIKFTDKGHISISFKLRSVSLNITELSIEVKDTGIGIAFEEQATIFEAFKQSRHIGHRTSGGTGLGLNIAKQLTETMGGKITLQSKQGVGTTFSITLSEVAVANENTHTISPNQTENKTPHQHSVTSSASDPAINIPLSHKLNPLSQKALKKILQDDWNKLYDSHLLNDMALFAEKLKAYSNSHNLPELTEFADELAVACSRFDIDRIELFLTELKPIFVTNTDNPMSYEK